jgi:PAS domain S-box-containing protein
MPEQSQRLRQAIRVGNIGIFEHDHEAGTIYWSPELRAMYGWDADEPVTLPKIVAHVHPADAAAVVAAVGRAHDPNGDGLFDIEHRILDRQGRLRWLQTRSQTDFEAAGVRRPGRTIGATQDVTERRLAEERLRVLDSVLSSSTQAIAVADGNGSVTFANAALRKLWGYSERDPLVGRSLFDFWKGNERPEQVLAGLKEARARDVELVASRLDGSSFHLAVRAEAVCAVDGTLTQVLVTFTDVSERKRLEEHLQHVQKMESIGRLAGGVAHDFNNLLSVISGGIELGSAALPPEHPTRACLSDAAQAVRSAAGLTRQLLAFSRKQAIAPRALDLREVICRVAKMLDRLLGGDIRLATVVAPGLMPIWFDPTQVEQIILNLAVNARDAMAQGGQLTIQASNCVIDEQRMAERAEARAGTYVLLAVSDEGIGLSDEVRAHLFEPFFTTKDVGKGTGLGLAMVYGAVEQHGGWLEVESELGRGSTFKIYLPTATPAAPATPS